MTEYIGGHGIFIGCVIIDSGKFDWVATKDRFSVLNEPDPSYHSMVYTEALGEAACIGRCRVIPLRNTGLVTLNVRQNNERETMVDYKERIEKEMLAFNENVNVHELPEIFHY